MLVTIDPDDNTLINLTFDAPMLWIGLVDTTDWTFGARTVTGTENFTNGGRSMQCHLSGAVSTGDSWHIECANETNYLASINGGRVNTTDGLIADAPAGGTAITDVAIQGVGQIVVTFSNPVAAVPNPGANYTNILFTGWTVGGNPIIDSIEGTDAAPFRVTIATLSAITSGLTYAFPTGADTFISLDGQSIIGKSGTLAP